MIASSLEGATWLYVCLNVTLNGCQVVPKAIKLTTQYSHCHKTQLICTKLGMEWIILVGFFPLNNVHTCEVHLFSCRNMLVLNQVDHGIGIVHWIQSVVRDKLPCYPTQMMELTDVAYVFRMRICNLREWVKVGCGDCPYHWCVHP